MSDVVAELEPRSVWQAFAGLAAIPRPSRHEEKVSLHVRRWAEEQGFRVLDDNFGNLAVLVPASAGLEQAPRVILQTHLDMVAEKNSSLDFDFLEDSISLQIDGDWVTADGTTLGADNGLGAASAMAIAIDPDVRCGPLCLLFTIQEEIGLRGAAALDPALLEGDLLINLDTEEDDSIYIGCAGAAGSTLILELPRADGESRSVTAGGTLCELAVTGLRGGHSGMDIIENRGNAIKILARVLHSAIESGVDFGLVSLAGGDKANAIPRECVATVLVPQESVTELEDLVEKQLDLARIEFSVADPGIEIELRPLDSSDVGLPALETADRDRLVALLTAAPHGPRAMSRDVAGLVEVSTNLAIVDMSNNGARAYISIRSSQNAAFESTRQSIAALARLAGAQAIYDPGYPGWRPDPESRLVARAIEVYRKLFKEEPGVKAVHAGLECGILVEKSPTLEAISIGPEIRGAHSPEERARISSVAKFYRFLGELLANLAHA